MRGLAVRWRVALPLLVLLTILAPTLRGLAGGGFLPDLWLLVVLFLATPPPVSAWRQVVLLVAVAGLLRASVTAVGPAVAWTGIGAGVLARDLMFRMLRDDLVAMRLLTGLAAGLPLALLDLREAHRLGAALTPTEAMVRVGILALLWALLRRPPRLMRWKEGAAP
jgi:hypothetical protein